MDNHFNLTGTMIGYLYPFFLNNQNLSDSYYLYQITTPCLDEKDLVPYLSMTKISEKTKNEPFGKDFDILTVCLGLNNRKFVESGIKTRGISLLENILKKDNTEVLDNKRKFPLVKMVEGNGPQRSMITGLRDQLRWKNYRFIPGNYIDILWTTKDFLVMKICGDNENIWIEPVAAYRNTDVEMKNPIKVDWSKINYPRKTFTGQLRASELNRTLYRLELGSFDRRSFKL